MILYSIIVGVILILIFFVDRYIRGDGLISRWWRRHLIEEDEISD